VKRLRRPRHSARDLQRHAENQIQASQAEGRAAIAAQHEAALAQRTAEHRTLAADDRMTAAASRLADTAKALDECRWWIEQELAAGQSPKWVARVAASTLQSIAEGIKADLW